MSLTYQNNNGSGGTGTSVTVTMPAGHASGNFLFANIFVQAQQTLSLSGTGWNLIGQANESGFTHGIAWRVCDGSANDNTGPTWSWSGSAQYAGNVFRYTGSFYSTAPIGNWNIAMGSGTALSVAAIAMSAAGSEVLCDATTYVLQTAPTPTGFTADNIYTASAPAETLSHKIFTNQGDSTGTVSGTVGSSALWSLAIVEVRMNAPATNASGTVAQTLKLVTQAVTGQQWVNGTIAQTVKLVSQAASGWHSIFGTAAQTLKRITQMATSWEALEWGHITQTLKLVSQAASGWHSIFGTAAQTLKRVTYQFTAWTGAVEIGGIIQTLIHPMATQAHGWMQPEGPIVMTLQKARQVASGWAEIIGDVQQVLPLMKQGLIAAEVTLSLLYYATLDQLNRARNMVEKQIKSTFHGPPDDPLPPMTS